MPARTHDAVTPAGSHQRSEQQSDRSPRGDGHARPQQAGLFGSTADGNILRTAMAEFIGTFLLVLVGTSVASAVVMHGTYDAMAIGLALS